MAGRQERIDLEQEYGDLQAQLGEVVARLIELETVRAANEASLMEQAREALEQIRASIARAAELLDAVVATPDIVVEEPVETPERLELNEDTVAVLAKLFNPEDVQAIAQLEGRQKEVFITLLQKIWFKYSGPRGKSSTIQIDRFRAMYVRGLTIKEVADRGNVPRSIIATGLKTLVGVVSRSPDEERSDAVTRAQAIDNKPESIPVLIATPPAIDLEQPVTHSAPLNRPPVTAAPFKPPLRTSTPTPVRRPVQAAAASAPVGAERPVGYVPRTPQEVKQWVVERDEAIARALKGRYGRGDVSVHQAIDTMLSSQRTKFTPNHKEVIRSMLREVGVMGDAFSPEQARVMLGLPEKLRGFGFTDQHIKFFGMFMGLSISMHQGEPSILGLTTPRPIGQIMEEGRNGTSLKLLDVQVTLAQAMAYFLKGTVPAQQGADGILKT